MNAYQRKTTGLVILTLTCLLLLIPVAYGWLVNLEVAVAVFGPKWQVLPLWPSRVYGLARAAAMDVSTITWLAPLLTLVFPFGAGSRRLWQRWRRPGRAHADVSPAGRSCYPRGFGYFLITLGLAGTLYGMLIALSGVGLSLDLSLPKTPSALRRKDLRASPIQACCAIMPHHVTRT